MEQGRKEVKLHRRFKNRASQQTKRTMVVESHVPVISPSYLISTDLADDRLSQTMLPSL